MKLLWESPVLHRKLSKLIIQNLENKHAGWNNRAGLNFFQK